MRKRGGGVLETNMKREREALETNMKRGLMREKERGV